MSNLAVFSFENSQVRTFGTADNPLFVFSDVCAVLQHSNHNKVTTTKHWAWLIQKTFPKWK